MTNPDPASGAANTDDLLALPNFDNAIEFAGENTPSGATSPAGARGQMQVLPSTAANPGFGIPPAKDDSFAEYNRVGKAYANAMLEKYSSPAIAAAAYNAGPGQVEKWFKLYGDPRQGKISINDWINKIPFPETKAYVRRVVGYDDGEPVPTTAEAAATSPTPTDQPQSQHDLLGALKTSIEPDMSKLGAAIAPTPENKFSEVLQLMQLAHALAPGTPPLRMDFPLARKGA